MLTNDLFKVTPTAETLMHMLADKPAPGICVTDIPTTPHHHLTCENCGILTPCFDDCGKTTGICHDCATGSEGPAWSPKEALRRFEAKRTAEARQRLIAELTERLLLLTDLELVQVTSFIEEVAGR